MGRKPLLLIVMSVFSAAVVTLCIVVASKNQSLVSAGNVVNGAPFSMTLDRSITSSEISAGEASFETSSQNRIEFGFDSSKASTSSGLISLGTGGYFENNTKITGMTKMEITISSGSAKVAYGYSKDALCVGAATLSGTNPIIVNFDEPVDYFKITDVAGPLNISSIKLTYNCSNTVDPTMVPVTYTSGTSWVNFTMPNWATSQKTVSFMFKKVTADSTGIFKIRLADSTKSALGYVVQVTVNADSISPGSPANIEYFADGWYKFMLDPALLTKQAGRDGSETMSYLQIADISAPIMVAGVKSEEMFKPQNGKYYDLPSTITAYNTSSSYLTFKVKKVSDSGAGVVQMNLSNGSTNSYGIRFTFVANGAPTVTGGSNRACSSVEDLGGGWYLITSQTGKQIGGSAFDASKLYYSNYSGVNDFYLRDLSVH